MSDDLKKHSPLQDVPSTAGGETVSVSSDITGTAVYLSGECARLRKENKTLRERAEKAEAACAAARSLLEASPSGEHNIIQFEGCSVCAIPPEIFEELHSLDGTPNPGQPLLDELRNFREFAQALLPSVQPLKPGLYDKACGEMYAELSKRIYNELAKLRAENERLAGIVEKLTAAGNELSMCADQTCAVHGIVMGSTLDAAATWRREAAAAKKP